MRNTIKIAYYETLHILKEPMLFLIVFLAPLAYALLIGATYSQAIISNIPLAIVDLDHSSLSRDIEESFSNSPYFQIVKDINTYEELEEAMQIGKVRAGIVIPQDLQENVSLHRPSEVLSVYDGSNLIWGYNIRKYTLEAVREFSAEHTVAYLAGKGLNSKKIGHIVNSVDCNIITWYNPGYNYSNYLFMVIVMMIIHQLGLLGVSLTVTREKERHTWTQYLAASVSRWGIILGKCLPYFIINFFNYTLLLWISVQVFHVKIEGSLFLIILLGLLYDLILTLAGFFISLKAVNSLQVTRVIMMLSVPMFFLSGLTWPWTYMPQAMSLLGKLLPFSWMAQGFRMVTVKNLGFSEVSGILIVMLLLSLIALGLVMTFDKTRRLKAQGGLLVNEDSYPCKRIFTDYRP
ncbi:MAG: ABC transporter permease [Desulfotomaculaceae bacterium]|nr:ABC transporter permease [Desulfotomaculaceae bacterium]